MGRYKLNKPRLHHPFKRCFWCGKPLPVGDKHKINMSKNRRRRPRIVYACTECRNKYLNDKLINRRKIVSSNKIGI